MSVMAMPARITQARRKWSERTMNVRQPVTARFELGQSIYLVSPLTPDPEKTHSVNGRITYFFFCWLGHLTSLSTTPHPMGGQGVYPGSILLVH